jgi:hypothetical protein
MKMVKSLLLGASLALAISASAYAAETTKAPTVGTETGTSTRSQAEIMAAARLQLGAGTGTAASNAVTINRAAGVITTEALTTAAGATQAITLTSNKIRAGDMVFAVVDPNGSAGTPVVVNVAVAASTATILVQNVHASAALDAAIKIMFFVVTAGNPN